MIRVRTKPAIVGCLSVVVLSALPLSSATATKSTPVTFKVSVPGAEANNLLPIANTCDGASVSPALAFAGIPKNTKSIAVIMHGVPGPARPGETEPSTHVYWTLYNLPGTTKAINQGSTGGGMVGHNFKDNNLAYTPPCSQGSGSKQYTITAYALKAPLTLSATNATRDSLLSAMSSKTLASSVLVLNYERKTS